MLSMILGPIAERLIPVLQTPVEDIIYEVLDQKGLPTRAEVRDLRNKLDRLEKTLGELSSALENLRTSVDEASEKAAAAAAKADAAPKAAPAKAADAKAAPAKKAEAKKAAPAKKAAGKKVCRVPDCEKPVRAKGFCGAHYQRFKRGTLVGWVGSDGSTTHEEVRYQVGKEYVGQPVETSYEGDDVLFFLPESDGKRLTLKVNDVRID